MPPKRFCQVPLSYAAATANDDPPEVQTNSSTISSITSVDLDQLYEKMKKYVGNTAPSDLNIEDLESRMATSSREIQEIRNQLTELVTGITARVDLLSEDIKTHTTQMASENQRQNIIILGMQQQFQDSISDFSKKLQEIYTRTGSAAQPITPRPLQGINGVGEMTRNDIKKPEFY